MFTWLSFWVGTTLKKWLSFRSAPTKVVNQHCEEHPERQLLAFAYGYLGEHDLLGARTEAEKYLMLAVLNLVECVAFVGVQIQAG